MSCTLCIIAKDEEHQISRCINSAKPSVDEIVVVDTGSTDRTVQIARELGAKVYETEWQDDFSLARNKSMEHATGEWILFLDCDEELDARTAPNLKGVIKDENYDGYWMKLINVFDNRPSTSLLVFRLFRNNPAFRFECRIHEQVLPSILRNSSPERIGRADITINHYGYENAEVVLKSKIERNLRMLEKLRGELGDTGFVNFNLGSEHQRLGNYPKALEYYSRSLAGSSTGETYTPAMIRSMVFCLMNLGRLMEGMALVETYLQVYPDYTDLMYLKGLLYLEEGKHPEALDCLNRCLEMGPPPDRYFSICGIADEKPRKLLKVVTDSLIRHGTDFFRHGLRPESFSILETAFGQLKKTPDQESYTKLIETMLAMAEAV